MKPEEKFHTHKLLNKPIFIMGLPPFIFLGACLCFLFISMGFISKMGMVSLLVIIPLAVFTVLILKKLAKEQKKGCPDLIASYVLKFTANKERYSDQKFFLKYLKK